jgi:hypothetical protein
MITVLLLNYKRPDNLHRIIGEIKSQTLESTIFVWNNGGEFEDARVDWQINSSINCYCRPRWFMSQDTATEFVCTMDDDLCFADNRVREDSLNALCTAPECAIAGMTGVILKKKSSYGDCVHLDWLPRFPEGDVAVDIVKGRFMLLHTRAVSALDYRAIDAIHDDIAVFAMVGGGNKHFVPGVLRGRFTELPQKGVGLGRGSDWLLKRERARRHYFS